MQGLDSIFHALSDPTRRKMVERLSGRAYTVSQLAEPFSISLPAVTKHLGVLESAKLIRKERQGKNVFCHLNPKRLSTAEKWLEKQRSYWSTQLDSFAKFVEDQEGS